jgi:hypothetical protein
MMSQAWSQRGKLLGVWRKSVALLVVDLEFTFSHFQKIGLIVRWLRTPLGICVDYAALYFNFIRMLQLQLAAMAAK